MMSRPSHCLPEGWPKKVSPFGEVTSSMAADLPPVSEFESPKLYIAGKSHGLELDFPPPITIVVKPSRFTHKCKKMDAHSSLETEAIGRVDTQVCEHENGTKGGI